MSPFSIADLTARDAQTYRDLTHNVTVDPKVHAAARSLATANNGRVARGAIDAHTAIGFARLIASGTVRTSNYTCNVLYVQKSFSGAQAA